MAEHRNESKETCSTMKVIVNSLRIGKTDLLRCQNWSSISSWDGYSISSWKYLITTQTWNVSLPILLTCSLHLSDLDLLLRHSYFSRVPVGLCYTFSGNPEANDQHHGGSPSYLSPGYFDFTEKWEPTNQSHQKYWKIHCFMNFHNDVWENNVENDLFMA